jgi:DNA helicase HerA-like ATPase
MTQMTHNIYYPLWLDAVGCIPSWELYLAAVAACVGLLLLVFHDIIFKHKGGIARSFEKVRLKKKDLNKAILESAYIEITIPRDSQTTAFQIQQKILKAFHSIYNDPIKGPHHFFRALYIFQKMFRLWKVRRARQVFFTMQIFAEYPHISLRLNVPKVHLERIEKAVYNAYPNAEISMVDKAAIAANLLKFQKSYLCYGQSTIEGSFYHRVKTFKDVSSDPVDSVISAMEGLGRGQFMVYNITVSPASHFFNQVIHYMIEQQEMKPVSTDPNKRYEVPQTAQMSELSSSVSMAMLEKMKASLFQIIISYWAVSSTPEDAEAKLSNIQAVLTEINQKNMNTLTNVKLFTKQIEELEQTRELPSLINMRPVLRLPRFKYWPFGQYKNYGQVVSDAELYSFWHLPNTSEKTVSSIKMTRFRKLPASREMREFSDGFFIPLGTSNFRMQEEAKVGIATWEDMKKHVYILGGTGSGKSETLKTIIHHLLQKEGEEQTACLIIDPKNDFATDLLTMIPESRKDDVVYFNSSKQKEKPIGFPFFAKFSGEKTNDEKIEFLVSIMKRFVQIDSTYSWGPELENILRQLFLTAYLLPEQSLSGLDLLLHEPTQIKNILKFLPQRLQHFWTSSILKRTNNDLAKYLATTNNKIGKFLDYPELLNITDRMESKITFEEMIHTKKIFIANLGSSSEQMKKYYSVYLTAHIAEAVFGQARIASENRKPTVFIVDEFQRVSSDMFETLFSEVRAFNTALVISNQFMGQLDLRIQKSIESNIASKIFMRTQSVDDALIAEKILGGKVQTADVVNLPTGTAYFKTLVHGIPQEAMSISIEKTNHPSDIVKDTEELYIQESMERYGTPMEVIKQKRETVNSTYYSAEREQIFFEQMGRQSTFPAAPETEDPEQSLARLESSRILKTIFNF